MFLEMYKIPLLCESNHKWKIDGLILNFEVNRLTLYDQDILFKNLFFFWGHAKKLWVRDENTKKEIINILE